MDEERTPHTLFGKEVFLDHNEPYGHIRMSARTWIDLKELLSKMGPVVISNNPEDHNATE
jgi:hypothetical protein